MQKNQNPIKIPGFEKLKIGPTHTHTHTHTHTSGDQLKIIFLDVLDYSGTNIVIFFSQKDVNDFSGFSIFQTPITLKPLEISS